MARLKSTYSIYMKEQELKGRVVSLTYEETMSVDIAIARAFSSAGKEAIKKQSNSLKLLKKKELKNSCIF